MKFSIGDKILLKHTGEEGFVSAYINQQMVEVDVNGATFPVHNDDIEHPYLKWFTEKKPKTYTALEQLPVEQEKFRKPRLAKGVYLSFLAVYELNDLEDIVTQLKIYLLNELPHPIQYNYFVQRNSKTDFTHEGTLHGFGHLYLHNMPFEEMNDQPRFNWQLASTEDDNTIPKDGVLRIRPVRMFEHINELLKNNEPTFSYLLTEGFQMRRAIPKPDKTKKLNTIPAAAPRIHTKPVNIMQGAPRYELDLHIEQLVDNTRGLTNSEIIKIQLDTLQRYLYIALVNHQERMIIIHGLGKGVLRDEVQKILKQMPEVSTFKNEWHGRYGFGATEVHFKY
jgi:hypothetical protein